MANKREFKKYVDAVAASVVEEMMIAWYNVEGADRKAIGEAVGEVLDAASDAKDKANVFFDRGVKGFADKKEYSKSKKTFFSALFFKIESEFNAVLDSAIKKFNAALPASVKEAQKKAVAQ